jgi:hypothetical protein
VSRPGRDRVKRILLGVSNYIPAVVSLKLFWPLAKFDDVLLRRYRKACHSASPSGGLSYSWAQLIIKGLYINQQEKQIITRLLAATVFLCARVNGSQRVSQPFFGFSSSI